jgi:integrase
MLAEPQERVREASREEEARILAATAEGYRDVLEAAFLSGCRTCELVGRGASLGWALRWENVDFINRRFRVTGKGGRARFIPMSEALFALFRRLLGSHPEFVFTYPAARTRLIRRRGAGGEMVEERIERGRRYPVTEAGLRRAARAAFAAAGVTDFRRHDTRHTAASRITRAAGIRAAQKLLGHADIKTTVKYAHVQDSDLRHAMDAADAATENATADELREAIALIRQRKSG